MTYGDKRDYRKIDIYFMNVYAASTTWARTCKEATEAYAKKQGISPAFVTANFNKEG